MEESGSVINAHWSCSTNSCPMTDSVQCVVLTLQSNNKCAGVVTRREYVLWQNPLNLRERTQVFKQPSEYHVIYVALQICSLSFSLKLPQCDHQSLCFTSFNDINTGPTPSTSNIRRNFLTSARNQQTSHHTSLTTSHKPRSTLVIFKRSYNLSHSSPSTAAPPPHHHHPQQT